MKKEKGHECPNPRESKWHGRHWKYVVEKKGQEEYSVWNVQPVRLWRQDQSPMQRAWKTTQSLTENH